MAIIYIGEPSVGQNFEIPVKIWAWLVNRWCQFGDLNRRSETDAQMCSDLANDDADGVADENDDEHSASARIGYRWAAQRAAPRRFRATHMANIDL